VSLCINAVASFFVLLVTLPDTFVANKRVYYKIHIVLVVVGMS